MVKAVFLDTVINCCKIIKIKECFSVLVIDSLICEGLNSPGICTLTHLVGVLGIILIYGLKGIHIDIYNINTVVDHIQELDMGIELNCSCSRIIVRHGLCNRKNRSLTNFLIGGYLPQH